jgi:hypothetical protein
MAPELTAGTDGLTLTVGVTIISAIQTSPAMFRANRSASCRLPAQRIRAHADWSDGGLRLHQASLRISTTSGDANPAVPFSVPAYG